jgi:5-hydroxyisourate hydrolase
VSGRLTTHVLDTAQGRPAGDLVIELVRLDGGPEMLRSVRTNADGRPDQPLLEGEELRVGTYELRFAVGAYFAGQGLAVSDLPFLDIVPVRIGVADPDAHYHVPLLASPWAYSTYRGS